MEEELITRLSTSEEPSIRYRWLTGFCGMPEDDPRVLDLRSQVKASARTQKLLEARCGDGKFPWHAYAKWRGAFWTLLLLEDLGYPAGDESLRPLLDQVFDWLLDTDRLKRVPQIDGRWRRCALQESSAVWCSIRLGLPDQRVEQLVELLLKWQWPDGGWNCDKKPAASHSSFYETWIPLRAMNAFAAASGDPRAVNCVERATEVFLSHRLFLRKDGNGAMDPGFTRLAYPPYWHYDILVGLQVMQECNRLSDPRCREALDLLESKRLPDGGFASEARYYKVSQTAPTGASPVSWGGSGRQKTNEFITVRALSVLHQAGRI